METKALPVQLELPLAGKHGGRREGAGRKRKRANQRTSVAHRSREEFRPRFPVLVTLKLRDGLPSLRTQRLGQVVIDALEVGARKPGFRLCEYTIQMNHLHLIVEADSYEELSRGMNGLTVRLVRAINRTLCRRGKVFPERFHDHPLRTPLEVKHALAYVLHNCHKHNDPVDGPDPLSSAWGFDGWDRRLPHAHLRSLPRPGTWLLSVGWKKFHGPLPLYGVPFNRSRSA